MKAIIEPDGPGVSADAGASAVQSVARALQLLDTVEAAGGSLSISAMASETTLSVGTVHRLVQTLVSAGYLRQLPDRRYCLGSRLARLGAAANELVGTHAQPILEQLAAEFGETANLAVLTGGTAEYLAQVAGRHSMRTFTEVGHRVPLHCTGVGKAMLSMLSDDEVRAILAKVGMPMVTPTTVTEIGPMLAELGRIRARGYGVDEGEMELGVRCVAVPIGGVPLMAVSISGPSVRVTTDVVRAIAPALVHAGTRLAELLPDR